VLFAALPLLGQDAINPDRPGIADGSATVDRGQFQIEFGVQREHDDNGRLLSTPLLLRYGLTKSFELRLETNGYERLGPHVFDLGDYRVRSDPAAGYAPVSIGMKVHFHDTPSLGVIARLYPPSGSSRFRSETTAGDVRLAADLTLNDKWSLNPNLGLKVEDGDTSGLAALTAQYNVTDKANVFVDGDYADSALLLDAGGALVVGRNLQLDASVGWRAHGVNAPKVFVSAGISRRF
jgi:hypothetical protein